MPSVTISSVAPSWFTSLRSTKRSTAQATTNITAPAPTMPITLARKRLSPPSAALLHSEKRAIASAATSTIAPWAKLNTPEALKMSTKPRATSEYSMPVISPPTSFQ